MPRSKAAPLYAQCIDEDFSPAATGVALLVRWLGYRYWWCLCLFGLFSYVVSGCVLRLSSFSAVPLLWTLKSTVSSGALNVSLLSGREWSPSLENMTRSNARASLALEELALVAGTCELRQRILFAWPACHSICDAIDYSLSPHCSESSSKSCRVVLYAVSINIATILSRMWSTRVAFDSSSSSHTISTALSWPTSQSESLRNVLCESSEQLCSPACARVLI